MAEKIEQTDHETYSVKAYSGKDGATALSKKSISDHAIANVDRQHISMTVANVVSEILQNTSMTTSELDERVERIYRVYRAVYEAAEIPDAARKRQFVSSCGLAMSPDRCMTTILDGTRVSLFLRGLDRAISHFRQVRPSKKIHIAYPACGPFAPLVLPLLTYYRAQRSLTGDQLGVSLVDIQSGAVQSLKALTEVLDIQDYINDIAWADATTYKMETPPNILVIEAMQHGLSREGHLLMAQHFAKMMPSHGVMLPQKITVHVALNFVQKTLLKEWRNVADATERLKYLELLRQEDQASMRVNLGEILEIDLPFLRNVPEHTLDKNTRLVQCSAIHIPRLHDDKKRAVLLICSKVTIWEELKLEEYDSGITQPLPDANICLGYIPKKMRRGDILVQSGDRLIFYYCMTGHPGFIPMNDLSHMKATNPIFDMVH